MIICGDAPRTIGQIVTIYEGVGKLSLEPKGNSAKGQILRIATREEFIREAIGRGLIQLVDIERAADRHPYFYEASVD